MSNSNNSPYQPPSSDHAASEPDNGHATTSRSLLPFAQLGLRLLGVMLIVNGLGAILGGLVQGLVQARAYAAAGYPIGIDPHSAGWAAGGIPFLVIGVYLIGGGNWILRTVFMPSRFPPGTDANTNMLEWRFAHHCRGGVAMGQQHDLEWMRASRSFG
ncbi:MAG: hypothetical protein AAFU85_02795 [Planctomycetota bacterium]